MIVEQLHLDISWVSHVQYVKITHTVFLGNLLWYSLSQVMTSPLAQEDGSKPRPLPLGQSHISLVILLPG